MINLVSGFFLMSMRRMKLEAPPFVPSLYFLLISRNKVKIVFFFLFRDLSVQYKNIPKIEVLRMACQFNMIFWEYLRIYCAKITTGGAATWSRGWRARPTPLGAPPCLVGPQWPSSTYSCTHLLPLPHTNPKNQLKLVFQPLLL